MDHTQINSGHIVSVGHDPKTGHMEIKFKGGRTYRYEGIDAEKFTDFCNSPSKGKFHHKHIAGQHPFTILPLD